MSCRSISRFRRTCSDANSFVQSFQDKINIRYDCLNIIIFANIMFISVEKEGRSILTDEGISSLAIIMHKLSQFSKFSFQTISIVDNSCSLTARRQFAVSIKPFVEYLATSDCTFELSGFTFEDTIRKTGFHAT